MCIKKVACTWSTVALWIEVVDHPKAAQTNPNPLQINCDPTLKDNWVPAVACSAPISGPLTALSLPMWFPESLGTDR